MVIVFSSFANDVNPGIGGHYDLKSDANASMFDVEAEFTLGSARKFGFRLISLHRRNRGKI